MESMKNAFAMLCGVGFIALMVALQCMLAAIPIAIGLWLWKLVF